MRYDVAFLSAGEAESTQVDACDAATAVATVEEDCAARGTFELLSVVPTATLDASQTAGTER